MLRNAITEMIEDALALNPNSGIEWAFAAGIALMILGMTWDERNKP